MIGGLCFEVLTLDTARAALRASKPVLSLAKDVTCGSTRLLDDTATGNTLIAHPLAMAFGNLGEN
jgi:hypothetical protein